MFKHYIALTVVLSLAVLGVFQGLQFFAVVCLLMAIGIFYRHTAKRLIDVAIDATNRTQSAKFGGVELKIGQSGFELDQFFEGAPDWMKTTLAGLKPAHIGILVLLSKSEKIEIKGALEQSLRELRTRGLVEHEMPTLAGSTTAWLSQTGLQVVERITDQPVQVPFNILDSALSASPTAKTESDRKELMTE